MSPHVVGLTFAEDERRGIPGIDRQGEGIGGDECDKPRMERDFLFGERGKTQGHSRQHGHPDHMGHSEQPDEACALIDQHLGEHRHAYSA